MIDRGLILDFGSQYTQLIARRVRETGLYSEILPVHGGRRHDPGVRAQGRDPFGRPGVDHRGGRAAAPAAVLELGAFVAVLFGWFWKLARKAPSFDRDGVTVRVRGQP